jgi:predicted DNA-binding transcriptional regulator AlpA
MAANSIPKNSDPLVGSVTVRHELGGISNSTLYRKIKSGQIPPPDAQINSVNYWLWSSVLNAKDNLISGYHLDQEKDYSTTKTQAQNKPHAQLCDEFEA